ncbi:MAG TPA: PIN domain-containing protein [Streptosporangiaceae bacterium]
MTFMNGSRRFLDTNVVVYAYDVSAGDKHRRARSLLEDLWESRDGCVSVQVLQEFFVAVTRKVPKPLDAPSAAQVIRDLARWRVHSPNAEDVLAAVDLHSSAGISLWDAMIVRSAFVLGCDVLYSEDLNPGQSYAGVRARNPFA